MTLNQVLLNRNQFVDFELAHFLNLSSFTVFLRMKNNVYDYKLKGAEVSIKSLFFTVFPSF